MNTKPYLAFALVAGLGLALGACSSSSDDPPAMPDLTLDGLQMGATVMAGTHTISDDLAAAFDGVDEATAAMYLGVDHPEGTTITLAGLDIECTSGPCSVTVNDDGSITTTGTIMVAEAMAGTTPPVAVEPTELEAAQMAASDAADAAKTASDNAATAAEDAMTAGENLATMQTDAMSAAQAAKAQDYADTAMAAYMDAKEASEAAADATTVTAAVEAKADAEDARDAAQAAEEKAVEYGEMAEESAMGELMISGTMKSVGSTTVDAAAPKSEVTSGSGDDAVKVITGLLSEPVTTGMATDGRVGVDAVIDTNPPTKYVSPRVNAAQRDDLEIGKVVDSADDMARLQIITAYASTRSVRVYEAAAAFAHSGSKAGTVEVTDAGAGITAPGDLGTETNVELELRPVGMFFEADNDNGGTDGTLDPGSQSADSPAGDTVSATAKAKQVYSFVNTADTTNNQPTIYVVLDETIATTDDEGETTTVYEYVVVDIHDAVNQDGVGANDTPEGDEDVFVTAMLPVAKSYSHLHFGVWAALGDAAKNGDQEIDGLGIGFVQSIGDGMTPVADMLNHGEATYNGNWVATIQEADPDGTGDVRLTDGQARMVADFEDGEITATLTGLATLSADITGNEFTGDEATVMEANLYNLDADATFTGSTSGAFFGEAADESGGVFSFKSKDYEGGAFSGAIGGTR